MLIGLLLAGWLAAGWLAGLLLATPHPHLPGRLEVSMIRRIPQTSSCAIPAPYLLGDF